MSTRAAPVTHRFAYRPAVDGPHGRLGVLWFLLAVGACALGDYAVGLLFTAVGTVATLQATVAWQQAGREVDRYVAGASVGVVGLAALLGTAFAGIAVLAGVAASIVVAVLAPDRRVPVAVRAGLTLRTWVVPAVAATAVTAVARLDMGAVAVLLVLVSGYEVGDYLVGTGAAGVVEGPVAGMAAVGVLTFTEAVFQLGPFDARAAWVFGGLVAVLAPLGAPLASALVPAPDARVPALRRLDAWLVVAPVWCVLLWDYLA